MWTVRPIGLAAALLLAGTAAALAQAATPYQLAESKDWKAVSATGAKGKVCYALTKPQKMEPNGLNHGDVFFFVSTRPGEHVRNEPSIQVGYPFKEGSKLTVDIDGKKFTLFTRGDGAWFENATEEAKLVDAMKKGKKMSAQGQSGRGNTTTYAFSLAGFGEMLDAIGKGCK
ncbi:invasion associated locus B family protein [Methyloraptor flagellatus]|jgi:invasion protein IalB|uniref:Invasion associated locus B family protein n=1 Tax=Methyloraptor flagellatus TaxID=3162530 RepID=A0AAU7XB79_9HYPH